MDRIMRGVENSNLPPSIEAAYYKKSIELKRRITEIEHNNDVKRANLQRVNRDVQKLRLERALLIEMVRNGMESVPADPASEASEDDAPPSPPNKPTRIIKRVGAGGANSKAKAKADGADDEDVDDTAMLPGTSPPPQEGSQEKADRRSSLLAQDSHDAAAVNGASQSEDVAMTDDTAGPSNSTATQAADAKGESGFSAVNG